MSSKHAGFMYQEAKLSTFVQVLTKPLKCNHFKMSRLPLFQNHTHKGIQNEKKTLKWIRTIRLLEA